LTILRRTPASYSSIPAQCLALVAGVKGAAANIVSNCRLQRELQKLRSEAAAPTVSSADLAGPKQQPDASDKRAFVVCVCCVRAWATNQARQRANTSHTQAPPISPPFSAASLPALKKKIILTRRRWRWWRSLIVLTYSLLQPWTRFTRNGGNLYARIGLGLA
jgi:hypothetical protein